MAYADKTLLGSKKFIAYVVSQFGWTGMLVLWFSHLTDKLTTNDLILSCVLCFCGLGLQFGYILGQASLDKLLATVVDIVPGVHPEPEVANAVQAAVVKPPVAVPAVVSPVVVQPVAAPAPAAPVVVPAALVPAPVAPAPVAPLPVAAKPVG